MRIAIYARVSTEEQKNGRTIDSQIQELERYATAHGHVIMARYVDDGWTGSALNRPALDRLRDEADGSSFEAVLIADVDRLSRDVANLAVVKRDLERKGVALLFQKLPNDNSPLANFMVNILGSFAEFERALIADRTRRGRRYKVQERGLIMGNLPPYGYNYVKKDRQGGVEGHYTVNQEEVRVVRAMYSWVADEGLSVRAVARRLNDLGFPARHGPRWARSSVRRVLANETYTGVTYYYKHRIALSTGQLGTAASAHARGPSRRTRDRAEWVPIQLDPALRLVERTLFERVQSQMRRNGAFSPRNVQHFYLLREVRKTCAHCAAAYVGTPCHGQLYYRCSNRGYPTRCRARIVSARALEPAVWNAVATAVQDPALIIQQVTQLQARRAAELAKTENERGGLRRDLESVTREEDRVLKAYRTGAMALFQFEGEIAKINRRRSSIEEQLRDFEDQDARDSPAVVATAERDITEWAQEICTRLRTFTDHERQRFLGEILTEVVIEDEVVRLRGQIPRSPESTSDSDVLDGHADASKKSHIAHTPIGQHARNVAHTPIKARARNAAPVPTASSLGRSRSFRDTSRWCRARNATRTFEFELPMPQARVRAAS